GKVAASWMFAPEFLPAAYGHTGAAFMRAVAETDVVISVSECTRSQFAEMYGYTGPIAVVRYHSVELLRTSVPLPPWPPFRIGFMGRIAIAQKTLDTIIEAYRHLAARRGDVVFNFHGGGSDLETFRAMIVAAGLGDRSRLRGPYDHRQDLA